MVVDYKYGAGNTRRKSKSFIEDDAVPNASHKWSRKQTNRQERRYNKISIADSIKNNSVDEFVDTRYHLPYG